MPYTDIVDRFTVFDILHDFDHHFDPNRIIATDLTAVEALALLRHRSAETAAEPGGELVEMWNHAVVTNIGYPRPVLVNVIRPVREHNRDDLEHLLRTSLRMQWPNAQFTVVPPPFADAAVEWVDGPQPNTVDFFVRGWFPIDHPLGASFGLRRHLSPQAWPQITDRAEPALGLTVPRTRFGAIDWSAAHAIRIPAPVRIGYLDTSKYAGDYTEWGLDEVLRMLADYIDFTDSRRR
ncbi:hypothetical protein ACIA8C_09770 [Nocardia sp. NPDC051321]|uniref:hypothetical protein n=1 Tax=Nocardia sp. NPDC051321 TaxID=3364323 RepID=UPI00378CD3DB